MSLAKKKKILAACGSYTGIYTKKSSEWLPSSIPGLKLWYDANSPLNIKDLVTTNTFAQLTDLSGEDNHAIQVTKNQQPLVSVVGDIDFWNFDGANDIMPLSDPTFLNIADDYSIFCIFKNTTIVNASICISASINEELFQLLMRPDSEGANYSYWFQHHSASTSGGIFPWKNLGNGYVDTRNTTICVAMKHNSSGYNFRINGIVDPVEYYYQDDITLSFPDMAITPNFAALGALLTGSYTYKPSFMCDLIIFDKNVIDDELTNIENYLMTKHSIT